MLSHHKSTLSPQLSGCMIHVRTHAKNDDWITNHAYLVHGPRVIAPLRRIVALDARCMQRRAVAPTRQERQHHRAPTHARRPQHGDGAVGCVGPRLARYMHGHQRRSASRAGERDHALGAHAVIARQLPGAHAHAHAHTHTLNGRSTRQIPVV
jgi:hypothetical protein